MINKQKIIVILGQTSTGKSDFAVEVAKQIAGEIISADSRQVYKGMDLGTGKITKKEMSGVPHYLLDVVSPKNIFTVSDFKKKANQKIKIIKNKNKIPIICGGTGFYIDSLINNTVLPEVPPNKKLRQELSLKSTEKLFKILQKLDKERAENIDKNNKVRLIRAIEITKTLGKVPTIYSKTVLRENEFEILKIGLTLPSEILKERIKIRLLKRIKKGIIREVDNLHQSGISWKRLNNLGLEYRYVSIYLQEIKKLSSSKLRQAKKKEMIGRLNTEIWHFAKRQKTWFKRDMSIIWINPNNKEEKTKILKEIKKFIRINP